ncbi:MAG: hypothetical protein K6G56_06430 [Clostridiales bacterium]|nr:hypothetical protein [Clostridiales bacterium]
MREGEMRIREEGLQVDRRKGLIQTLFVVPFILLLLFVALQKHKVTKLILSDFETNRRVDVTLMYLNPGDLLSVWEEPVEKAYGTNGEGTVTFYYEGATFYFSPSATGGGEDDSVLTRVVITGSEIHIADGNICVGVKRSRVREHFGKNERIGDKTDPFDIFYIGSRPNGAEVEFIYDSNDTVTAITISRPL